MIAKGVAHGSLRALANGIIAASAYLSSRQNRPGREIDR